MPPNEQKTTLDIVLGAGNFGEPGKADTRVHDIKELDTIYDLFRSHGHTKIDTARIYCEGTSEKWLGKFDLASKGLTVDTKLFPLKTSPDAPSHDEKGLREQLALSLKALSPNSIETLYLHAPDRAVPYEETLRVINELYKEGLFKKFGLSNYSSWEVAEIVGICKLKGYIQPTIYQGMYNAIHRSVEPELLPCLHKFGISFYAYSPLAGGLLTGRYHSLDEPPEEGSRFDPSKRLGQLYQNRYWKEPFFRALSSIKSVSDKNNLTLAEVGLRWMSHHSQLKREYGDAIIIGGSRLQHIEQNLTDLEKGPLPEEVLKVLDEAWLEVQSYASPYFF